MRFETPAAFCLVVFLPFLLEREHRAWLVEKLRLKKWLKPREQGVQFASAVNYALLSAAAKQSSPRAVRGAMVMSLLRAAAFLLLVFALARPQEGVAFRQIDSSGRDIMLALDLSGSMQALDFFLDGKRVDRLVALKSVVLRFIKERQGDRIGLVVFGDKVFVQCPLTTDHEALKQFVDSLEIGMAGQSTAIGDALGISLKRIRSIKENSKVIVLVTDGKSNAGLLQPKEAAEIAKKMGVKIYCIGIGGPEPAPFPVKDVFGRTGLVDREMEYDGDALTEIANITGGKYYNAKDTDGFAKIIAEISKIEERKEKTFEYVDYEERFLPFLTAGVLLFLTAELLASSWYLKVV